MEVIKSYVCPKFPKSAWSAVEIVVAVVLTRLVHKHGHNQSAANGFRRPGYNGYNILTALHADSGNFGHT